MQTLAREQVGVRMKPAEACEKSADGADLSHDRWVQPARPHVQVLDLRPRTVGEIIDVSVKLWGANWKRLFPILAAILFPFYVAGTLVSQIVKPTMATVLSEFSKKVSENPHAALHITNRQYAAFGAGRLIFSIGVSVTTTALTAIIADAYLRRSRSSREVLRTARRRGPINLLSFLLAVLVAGIPIGALLVAGNLLGPRALVIGSIPAIGLATWILIRLRSAAAAIVVERVGAITALKRGFALSKGRTWALFGATVVAVFLIPIPAGIIASMITGILTSLGGTNPTFEFLWIAIGGTVSQAIIAPLVAGISVLMYFDLRIRKEGFDLDGLAASIPHVTSDDELTHEPGNQSNT